MGISAMGISAMGIVPAWPWGLQGSSPGIPTALGASLAAGALSPTPGCRVWGISSPGIHWHTFCQPHQCPTPVSHGTGEQGHTGGPGKRWGLSPSIRLGAAEAAPRISPGCSG